MLKNLEGDQCFQGTIQKLFEQFTRNDSRNSALRRAQGPLTIRSLSLSDHRACVAELTEDCLVALDPEAIKHFPPSGSSATREIPLRKVLNELLHKFSSTIYG